MKYENAITIDADRSLVWEMFNDPDISGSWQPALKKKTLVAGVDGEVGSVYELIYDNEGRDITAIATVTEKHEPEVFSMTIDTESSLAYATYRFEEAAINKTRWTFEIEYRFRGIYWFVSLFLKKTMRARADDEMRNLKQLVEGQAIDSR